MILFVWLAAAAAEEPRTSEEIVVHAQRELEEARREVTRKLEEAGYDQVIHRDGKTIYRHDKVFMGQVVVDDDGWVEFVRQPVQFDPRHIDPKQSPLAWAGCLIRPDLCLHLGGQIISKRKKGHYERRLFDHVQADVEAWNARIADVATQRKIAELPARLEALWHHGEPLQGEAHLATPADRRRAILEFWGSRTDTPWGEDVRAAVEAFCRGVVQRSEHPFTEAEIAAFNATTRAARPFTLERADAEGALARPVAP